jgi:DNA-binding transcriptional LysR family regulator
VNPRVYRRVNRSHQPECLQTLRGNAYKRAVEHRQLKFFIAVAEELHFTRAAARLRIAQPHLSQEIRRVEREIGVELFARTKRSVALTPAGHTFLQHVRAVLDATADAVHAAQRASRGEIGRLRLGFVSTAAHRVIPDAVARFRGAYPDVELLLTELNSDEGLEALRAGQLDLCLLFPPRSVESALSIEQVWQEPLVAVLPPKHPLAAVRRIALQRLKLESWVFWRREIASRLYDEVVSACMAAGFEPRVAQRVRRATAALSLVAGGVGVALLPISVARLGIGGAIHRDRLPRPKRDRSVIVESSEDEAP